jgi:hypothetical protein
MVMAPLGQALPQNIRRMFGNAQNRQIAKFMLRICGFVLAIQKAAGYRVFFESHSQF